MIGIPQAFAASYAQARAQFVGAAAVAGLALQPQVHPLCGPSGETLALSLQLPGTPFTKVAVVWIVLIVAEP